MTDTSTEAQTQFLKMLSAIDVSRRIRMMSGMFSAARVLARAVADNSMADIESPQVAMFRRMYRTDFSTSELTLISEHLEAVHAGRPPAPKEKAGARRKP